HQYQKDLAREQDSERRKVEEAEKRRQREQLSHQRAITSELAQQRKLAQQLKDASKSSGRIRAEEEIYDVFISHASEDKEEFVRPLTQELESQGFKVWYDELTLKVGDSLRQSIDRGLAGSRYGVVVLSSAFFSKNWPQYELNGLTAREMDGAKVILPIWHKVSKNEVMQYSPTLADKVALNSSVNSVEEIANQLAEVLKDE
ncbi:MAG TPA: toll/interleukin-1 receptor domain-containing protein, partial [Abditibacteriaceae bacterium]